MQTIYLDVLLLQSLYVNYFLLRAAARVTHTPLRFARCLLVSAGSSLFSLLIFLPALPLLLQLLQIPLRPAHARRRRTDDKDHSFLFQAIQQI